MQNSPRQIFPGVFLIRGRIATASLAPGFRVYNEDTEKIGGVQYRLWNARKSKLGAAIVKGLKNLPITPGGSVLYIGAASGTTASHVSDIVTGEGVVFCVEFAPRAVRDLVKVCERRENMLPIPEDARTPENYADVVAEEAPDGVDAVFQDVADPEQVRILKINCERFLKKGGTALLALKARSISGTGDPQEIYARVLREVQTDFEVVQRIDLAPYDIDHMFLALRKKS
ncbi:fibrillarin-like rRNA/tRNA 2'-O-methyltransferase [Candidatus Micrarchaeota archaeon]|nr:fibrillarin-like rRNA/tRNA 2'-O-methyltransferase [Candidatus Micrarchaeota archaeon]